MSTRRPHVIVFVADDLGWGDLGSYGARAIPTPHLDALAARGVVYTDAHATSAVCSPSRYSLVTGLYPWRSPLQSGVLGGTDPTIIRTGQATAAGLLRDAGYRTGAFGKWHLGLDWVRTDGSRPSAFDAGFASDMQASGRDVDYRQPFTGGPIDHGFDRFFGIAGSLDMPPYCFLDQDRTVGIPDREKDPLVTSQRPGLTVEGWQDDQVDVEVTRAACDWIRDTASDEEPFFAYIAAAAPHRPCVPPEFVRGLSEAGARGDAVCLVDWMVGQLLETLREIGAEDDTVFLFTSDNGAPLIFPEDGDVEHHRPNGPWRGQKADTWEGGHRVPLIAVAPSAEPAKVDRPVSLLDIVPTIARLAGSASDVPLDGQVLGELADGGEAEPRIIAQQAFDGALALREGPAKAIFSTGSGGFSTPVGVPVGDATGEGQFYLLDSDPGEQDDLWAAQRAEASRMLSDYTRETGFAMTVVAENESAARTEGAQS